MNLTDDLQESRNLYTSSPPCKIDITSTHAATKIKAGYRTEETRSIVAGEDQEAHKKQERKREKERKPLKSEEAETQ